MRYGSGSRAGLLLCVLCAALPVFAVPQARPVSTVREVRALKEDAGAEGRPCKLLAHVVHSSALRPDTYIVTDPSRTRDPGVVLVVPASLGVFATGDILAIEGETFLFLRHAAIRAGKAEALRHVKVEETRAGKYSDLRKGILHARRISLEGDVASISHSGGETAFTLAHGHNKAMCRVRGRLAERYLGRRVKAIGAVFQNYNESGLVCDPVLEVEDAEDIRFVESDWRGLAIWALLAALLAALALLSGVWHRSRRERAANRAVAAERRRMATELHDTIEQHLATAKILLSGALSLEGLPDAAQETVAKAARVLAHAKVEVRDAVTGLRSDALMSLKPALAALAAGVPGDAPRLRLRLAALDGLALDDSRARDVAAIAREAVTNAVKHARPRNIAIVCDRLAAGENENAAIRIRVLNDGEPFDPASALGPEAGHFGLAGMFERSSRSSIALSFVRKDKWSGVQMEFTA